VQTTDRVLANVKGVIELLGNDGNSYKRVSQLGLDSQWLISRKAHGNLEGCS